jgi:uncharacterized metal-binding protein YceD (DUF177 family)
MNTKRNSEAEPETPRSRFAYHGDTPEIGGVTSVVKEPQRESQSKGGTINRRPSSPGVPRPEERLLDISELARTVGMRYTHRFAIPAHEIPDFDTATPIIGEITLTNAGDILILKGEAATTLSMECGRCLSPTDKAVETELEENFPLVATNTAYNQEEVQAVDEDVPTAVIKGNVLDLGDLLRQALTLAAPLQPLCREDCPGLEGFEDLVTREEEVAEEPEPAVNPDNPLKNLAALWEARQQTHQPPGETAE